MSSIIDIQSENNDLKKIIMAKLTILDILKEEIVDLQQKYNNNVNKWCAIENEREEGKETCDNYTPTSYGQVGHCDVCNKHQLTNLQSGDLRY